MVSPHRLLAILASVVAGAALAAPAAVAHEHPDAVTQPATDVGPTGATLHGVVTPERHETGYVFVYGTTRYDVHTPVASAGDDDAPVAVSARIEGLTPQTTYHVRLIAFSHHRPAVGEDVTFTTTALPVPLPPPVPAAPAAPTTTITPVALAPVAPPVLGQSVAVALRSGTVRVKPPGATAYVPLTDGASIPVGSLVDTRHGSVTLRSALPNGATQSGIFHGGLFEVRQTASGVTELVLRGAKPACARGRAGAAATSKRRRKPPRRRLWGRDEHGNFRTRGGNSVATVRGTAWYVEDRCDGTLTRVSSGRVSVYDRGRRITVIVRAGHSYLARANR
jgi:hypothetical protein